MKLYELLTAKLKVPDAEAKEVVAEAVKVAEKVNMIIDDKKEARFKWFDNKIDERYKWFKDIFATKEDLSREIGGLKEMIERNNNNTLRWVFLFWVAQLSAVIAIIKYLK